MATQLQQIIDQQWIWAKLFYLERQISGPEVYQKHYTLMRDAWFHCIELYLSHNPLQNIHRISYGFISQSLLMTPHVID